MKSTDPSARIVLARAIRAEWARLRTLRSMWLLVALTTVAVTGISMLVGSDTSPEQGQAVWMPIRRVAMLALLLLFSMASAATTADYGTGGIVPTLQWTPRRQHLLAARTIVIVVAVTLTALIPILVGGALATQLAPDQTWSSGQAADALATLAFVYALGALLAVGLGLLLRNTAASLGAVLALVLVLPLLLGNLPIDWTRDVAALLPGTSVRKLLIGEGLPGLTDTGARLTLAAWATGSLAAGGGRLLWTDANR